MITQFTYLAIPAMISILLLVLIRKSLKSSPWINSNKNFAGQSRFNGLLTVSVPAFTACMGIVCAIAGENLSLLTLGVKLSLASILLFITGSVITPVLSVKKRKKD